MKITASVYATCTDAFQGPRGRSTVNTVCVSLPYAAQFKIPKQMYLRGFRVLPAEVFRGGGSVEVSL